MNNFSFIEKAIAVKPAHPGHPGHPEHPAHPAHPANPAEPQNPRFSLFAPTVFYPFVIARAIIVTVATIIRSVIQCVLAVDILSIVKFKSEKIRNIFFYI